MMTFHSSLAPLRSPCALGLALALAAVVACMPAMADDAKTVPVPPGTLVVVDGDTVKIGRQRLRLLTIDAPEIEHARCRVERRAGERAKARVAELIARQPVTIEYSGRDDRYRRPLIGLAVPAGDIGAILMAEGLALPYRGGRAAWSERAAHWCGGSNEQAP